MITCSLIDKYTREDGKEIRLFNNMYMIIEDPLNDLYICEDVQLDVRDEIFSSVHTRSTRTLIERVANRVLSDICESMMPLRTHDDLGEITIYNNDILHYHSSELNIDAIIEVDYQWIMEGLDYDLGDSYIEDLVARVKYTCSR